MNLVLLGLGTNLGRRRLTLQKAVRGLNSEIEVLTVSPVYETEPWGISNQPDFLNICLSANSNKPPFPLLEFTKQVELELGRKPSYRWGPRLIDIDIIYFDALIINDGRLQIPHPRLAERAFVLAPLADVAADFVDPRSGLTVKQMLDEIDTSGVRQLPEPLFDVGGVGQ